MPRLMLLLFTLCLCAPVHSEVLARGELLYSNHCKACHSSEIYWRAQKLATDWSSLKSQVRRWQSIMNLGWSEEEIGDVAYFLNTLHYGFPLSLPKDLLQGEKRDGDEPKLTAHPH